MYVKNETCLFLSPKLNLMLFCFEFRCLVTGLLGDQFCTQACHWMTYSSHRKICQAGFHCTTINHCAFYFQFFPRWLAPNVLTFSGWSLLFMIYAVTCYYDPHFTASSGLDESKRLPSVWWLIFAVAQFTAHTFDGCDGKQARRTNSR